jgi:NAD(P)-dependent dehydrogenase (short-subunit alcohol dehydrogenase family)
MSTRIIISASSDIGTALAGFWLAEGHQVVGTFRTRSTALDELAKAGLDTVVCDLSGTESIESACREISESAHDWDVLVLAPGSQEPVGMFSETAFDEWELSVVTNFTAQLRIVHRLLESRNGNAPNGPTVLFFAGGGTNSSTFNYSSYTVSKIALIKMCELLDAEISGVKFTIIGPGWVDTKIHQATIRAGSKAGDNYEKTIEKLVNKDWVSMQTVIDCCNWVIDSDRSVVGGRNISLVFDAWGEPTLDQILRDNPDMYKLRRSGNDRMIRKNG